MAFEVDDYVEYQTWLDEIEDYEAYDAYDGASEPPVQCKTVDGIRIINIEE